MMINLLLELPFCFRVASCLFIIFVLWMLLGKVLLWICSSIPYFLGKIFILLYIFVEIPISLLHKKFGGIFYKIDNCMTTIGKKIDKRITFWYELWHSKYQFKMSTAIMAYCFLLFIVLVPSLVPGKNKVLSVGETIYLASENYIISLLEKQKNYSSEQKNMEKINEQKEINSELMQGAEIELTVYGVKSSLLVRDIPDMNNSTTLGRLYNGSKIVWTGDMVFAKAENNKIEPWVKVKTEDNMEGWCRMNYLYPESYSEIELYFQIK